ncbi:hypothetical protein SKAU_G00167400 [Synaphobranchus kaupii]|uniref:Uncharacterized protein n=1 Tax=Synaphobranchus kaupii TaxID=118154 RepID=A0A9Q1FKA1_SYNKA|nr:hypothetical protein SKAU_G00167400 [Synaphobranchus kaupii]
MWSFHDSHQHATFKTLHDPIRLPVATPRQTRNYHRVTLNLCLLAGFCISISVSDEVFAKTITRAAERLIPKSIHAYRGPGRLSKNNRQR